MMNFGAALHDLKSGYKMTRKGWNGPDQYIQLKQPNEDPEWPEGTSMTLPFIFIRTVQGDLVPWLASQTDLLAEDWARVE